MFTLEQLTNAVKDVAGLVMALLALVLTIQLLVRRLGRFIAPALPVIGNALADVFRLQGRYRRMNVGALVISAMSFAAFATFIVIVAVAIAVLVSFIELQPLTQAQLLVLYALAVAAFSASVVRVLNDRRDAHRAWARVRKLKARAFRIRQCREARQAA